MPRQRLAFPVTCVAPVCPGWRKFPQFMPDHVFCDKNRDEVLPVVYSDGLAHHIGDNHGRTRPGFDNLFALAPLSRLQLFHQLVVDIWPFFDRTRHIDWLLVARC